jgi:hypothetical protein
MTYKRPLIGEQFRTDRTMQPCVQISSFSLGWEWISSLKILVSGLSCV